MNKSNLGQGIRIPADSVTLEGLLNAPEKAPGVVIFAHGSGSSRLSPRNNFVAQVLRDAGLGTLLFDLLTEKEDFSSEARFNITLLTQRLKTSTQWFRRQTKHEKFKLGYFGSSTGAAAALQASVLGPPVYAIVSRGGRPDLAGDSLMKVQAPTLLIVGGEDKAVIKLNQEAFQKIKAEKDLKIIPGATHLFEEPGALDEVARLAAAWFKKYLRGIRSSPFQSLSKTP